MQLPFPSHQKSEEGLLGSWSSIPQSAFRISQSCLRRVVPHETSSNAGATKSNAGHVKRVYFRQVRRSLAAVALMGEWLAEGTVSEMLRKMNNQDLLLRAHQLYIDVLGKVVAGDDYAGPDLVGNWYTRNLRIFANIDRISEPGDRVLVLFGQGHAPILRDLVSTSEPMCLVEPGDYLP